MATIVTILDLSYSCSQVYFMNCPTLRNEALVSISDNEQRLKSPRNYMVSSPESKGIKLQALKYIGKSANKAMEAQVTQK